ncbi:MAG TPA: hypothetical protein VGX78_13625, partial [Pirellulales bacterium]|nr:hypothetical protein [Pirellulales bacterium]
MHCLARQAGTAIPARPMPAIVRRCGPTLWMIVALAAVIAARVPQPLVAQPSARRAAHARAEQGTVEPIVSKSADDEPEGGAGGPALGAVEFDGILPGVATIADVREAWGEPKESAERGGDLHQVYAREPFKRLEVTSRQGRVLSIAISLHESLPAKAVAEQLGLAVDPVTVYDDAGKPIGIWFPERGAALRLTPRGKGDAAGTGGQRAREVLLGEVDARAFALRAEERLTRDDTRALADLEAALALVEKQARAHWLRARVLLNVGRREAALEAVDRAIGLAPKQPDYVLTRARVLAESCRFDEAAAEIERAIVLCAARPEVKALALSRSGELSAAGPRRDFKRCVELAQQAIRTAQPLARDRRISVRRAAAEALIEAHLAAAHGVAWGRWKSKPDAVGQWLAKAEALVRDSIGVLGLDPDWELRLCSGALDAAVGAGGKINPADWAKRALEIGRHQIDVTDDVLHRRRLAWMLGLAMVDALQAFQMRREFEP